VPAASIAALRLDLSSFTIPELSAVRSLSVDNINRTDIKPTLGSSRQLLRTVDVAGSARSQATLAVEHATSALGDVLVYVFPDADGALNYSPPLRQNRSASSTTTVITDSTMVSGGREVISGGLIVTWDVPAIQLPTGLYLLMARLLVTSTATVSFTTTAAVLINGTTQAGGINFTTSAALTAGSYANVPIGRMVLPPVDGSISAATTVRVTFQATSGGGTVTLDEAWLFNRDIGRLVQTSLGTAAPASGGSSNRLFIRPPTTTTPRPTVRAGNAADQSDARSQGLSSWDVLQFAPPRANVLTVTSNAQDASVTLRHYPRWHTNAAS
jgi:hypothetical protein